MLRQQGWLRPGCLILRMIFALVKHFGEAACKVWQNLVVAKFCKLGHRWLSGRTVGVPWAEAVCHVAAEHLERIKGYQVLAL